MPSCTTMASEGMDISAAVPTAAACHWISYGPPCATSPTRHDAHTTTHDSAATTTKTTRVEMPNTPSADSAVRAVNRFCVQHRCAPPNASISRNDAATSIPADTLAVIAFGPSAAFVHPDNAHGM